MSRLTNHWLAMDNNKRNRNRRRRKKTMLCKELSPSWTTTTATAINKKRNNEKKGFYKRARCAEIFLLKVSFSAKTLCDGLWLWRSGEMSTVRISFILNVWHFLCVVARFNVKGFYVTNLNSRSMELFGRRRWTTGSAQQSNMMEWCQA